MHQHEQMHNTHIMHTVYLCICIYLFLYMYYIIYMYLHACNQHIHYIKLALYYVIAQCILHPSTHT